MPQDRKIVDGGVMVIFGSNCTFRKIAPSINILFFQTPTDKSLFEWLMSEHKGRFCYDEDNTTSLRRNALAELKKAVLSEMANEKD